MRPIVDDHVSIRSRADEIRRDLVRSFQESPVIIEDTYQPLATSLGLVRIYVDDWLSGISTGPHTAQR